MKRTLYMTFHGKPCSSVVNYELISIPDVAFPKYDDYELIPGQPLKKKNPSR